MCIIFGHITKCRCSGKSDLLGHYNTVKSHKDFFNELSTDIGIPITELIQVVRGGYPELQGTWSVV